MFSGCALWDGAVGHVINAVNWAGSGRGLGVVASLDGEFPGSYWWNNADSFLRDELGNSVLYFRENAPVLSAAETMYPLNSGLTSLGLSNWRNSFHAGFRHGGVPGYAEVVGSTSHPDYAVAIATSAFIDAPTAPLAAVPEPATWVLTLAGLAAAGIAAGRRGGRAAGASKRA